MASGEIKSTPWYEIVESRLKEKPQSGPVDENAQPEETDDWERIYGNAE